MPFKKVSSKMHNFAYACRHLFNTLPGEKNSLNTYMYRRFVKIDVSAKPAKSMLMKISISLRAYTLLWSLQALDITTYWSLP